MEGSRAGRPEDPPGAGARRRGREAEAEPEAEVEAGRARPAGRTLGRRLQEAVGQCFPLRSPSPEQAPASASASASGSASAPASASASASGPGPGRKVRISELMLDECPFPAGSDLAAKWHLIKQHTAPVSRGAALLEAGDEASGGGGQAEASGWSSASPPEEDEEERLRERRRISIERGVEPPPDAQIHTFEAAAPIDPLHRPGPKLTPGMNDKASLRPGTRPPPPPGPGSPCPARRQPETVASEPSPEQAASPGLESQPQPGPRAHTQIDYIHCLVPALPALTALPCYWGPIDRFQAEAQLLGRPEGSFLLRDSAQEDYLFSVSFRRYSRSLHARIEQWNHNFSFDAHDPSVFHAATVSGLLEHYKDPAGCMFFEPLLSLPVARTFPFSLQRCCRAAVSGCTSYDGIDRLPLPEALKEYLKEYHYKQKVCVRRLDTR